MRAQSDSLPKIKRAAEAGQAFAALITPAAALEVAMGRLKSEHAKANCTRVGINTDQ